MGYVNKISSLEDKASAQVAINLCQENGFKEIALRLEKPTYGIFIMACAPSFFVSDPVKLSTWSKVKEDDRLLCIFKRSCYLDDTGRAKRWDTTVDEQCQRLTEGIPRCLRQGIHAWINRIALEYLSYSRRQEVLFGVSRYVLMNIFTREDWKEVGRLDEKKLAQRLIEDERLTVLQRYRIACVYCLHVHIPQLWKRLTQEEKQFTSEYEETDRLVLWWSRHMDEDQEEEVTKNHLWIYAAQQATCYGNRAALMVCWKGLQEDIRQQIIIDLALESLRQWQSMGGKSHVKEELISDHLPDTQCDFLVRDFNLPSYYIELMRFFLLQMDKEQQLTFLKKAFQSKYRKSVLECFLDWPHQDDFLPTINRLWGIIPKDKYVQCLLALASKYSEDDEKENSDYDYRNLLGALWEETPEEYKQYVFRDKGVAYLVINEGNELLSRLLKRSPFQEKDEALFKQIFRDQPQKERRAMMRSEVGENMCSLLTQKGKWSLVNWLLEKCLSKEEIPNFKKQFIRSKCGRMLCLDTLEENREKLVEDYLDWSLESATEKNGFKDALIEGIDCLCVCEFLLRKGKFAEVERVINFCLSSDEGKERLKARFARCACIVLLEDYTGYSLFEECVWEQMDTIIGWSADTEEKITDIKKHLFFHKGIDIHYELVFIEGPWGKVESFYQWFGLSAEEIKPKKDTTFTPRVIENIHEELPEYTNALVAALRWCLADEEMVIDLKRKVEETYCTRFVDERTKKEKERLDHLISELLYDFRKEVREKTNREGVFVKDIYKGEKRSSVGIEDESTFPTKRRK